MTHIVALAGASGSGKSTLAHEMRRILGEDRCKVISTSAILRGLWAESHSSPPSNDELREFGNKLTGDSPSWFTGIDGELAEFIVIDALRSAEQLEILRRIAQTYTAHRVTTIYLGPAHPLEVELRDRCNQRVLTGYGDPAGQALTVLERVAIPNPAGGIDCVIGAQWGSEGKGKVAAWLAASVQSQPYSAMGRAGGPNAGHRVEMPDGSYRVFRHLPSATGYARPGTRLCIGPGAVVDLDVLRGELEAVPDGVQVWVDRRAAIVDENAREAERLAELTSIGSTMTGSGGAMALRVLRKAKTFEDLSCNDLMNLGLARVNVGRVGEILREARLRGRLLLESTQGMELSLLHGQYPHVTGRDVSATGLLGEMGLPPRLPCRWFLVARTYPIRVAGPSGELPGETTWAEVAQTSGVPESTLVEKERTTVTKRLRRVARWTRGSLIRVARRSFSNHDVVHGVVTFADYLRATDESRQALSSIIEEAQAVSSDGCCVVCDGPRTQDANWVDPA